MFWFMGSVYFERVISDVICIRQLCDASMDGRCSREMEKCVCVCVEGEGTVESGLVSVQWC